jgi:hypothetical protein
MNIASSANDVFSQLTFMRSERPRAVSPLVTAHTISFPPFERSALYVMTGGTEYVLCPTMGESVVALRQHDDRRLYPLHFFGDEAHTHLTVVGNTCYAHTADTYTAVMQVMHDAVEAERTQDGDVVRRLLACIVAYERQRAPPCDEIFAQFVQFVQGAGCHVVRLK